ncbi:uncharacterized protein V6R79_023406 [Siganus canaliculatus]
MEQTLGLPVGAEFSCEDVSFLYHKVFHIPSDVDEARAAMIKLAGDNSSWSCAGEKVLDVLVEMEREREKKEKFYWDYQLLNAGNLNTLGWMEKPNISDPHVMHRSNDRKAHKQFDLQPVWSRSFGTDSLQTQRLVRGKDVGGSGNGMKRLKKAFRQSWARLASHGVQSIVQPPLKHGQSPGFKGQAWGCATLSDVLGLLEVKYDVVTHLLYLEMLQEHHTQSIWEAMLPWQQQKEEEVLEDLAGEALESGDMLRLAELPGAFRIYRICLTESPRSSAAFREQACSAVSLLYELQAFCQKEMDALTDLGERLEGDSLTLLCLYVSLATLRAQREKMSYSALLAARQSWETWPHVESPCRADLAAMMLHAEDAEQQKEFISVSPQQQTVLQLLVLTQEQERKHLVKLLHGLSLKDLQEPECRDPSKEDDHNDAALRCDCIKRLRQIQADLQAHMRGNPTTWSQQLLEHCSLLLLTQLMDLQEIQVSTVLSALLHNDTHRVKALQDEYESKLKAECYNSSLQLLTSDVPPTPHPEFTENSSHDQAAVQSCYSGPATANSGVQAEDGAEICGGCGAVAEHLPYLEILSMSNGMSNTPQRVSAEGAAQVEEESNAMKSPHSYEKQGSLITLAWSKPPEDDAAGESNLKTHSQVDDPEPPQGEDTSAAREREDLRPPQLQMDSTCDPDALSADQQHSTLPLRDGEEAEQPEEGEAMSERDLSEHALVADTRQDVQPHLLDDADETFEKCPATQEPEPWELRGNEPAVTENQVGWSSAEREPTLMERQQATEPVSAMERERTMRSLVDMQRKVGQRHQRDRERQLLRVQERLSIIQNRKAEEDLLGLRHTERLKHLTQDLPQEDKNQQKTVVRERLEQLRRERSYVMQSKRDRNTTGFKELLGPVALHSRGPDDGAD